MAKRPMVPTNLCSRHLRTHVSPPSCAACSCHSYHQRQEAVAADRLFEPVLALHLAGEQGVSGRRRASSRPAFIKFDALPLALHIAVKGSLCGLVWAGATPAVMIGGEPPLPDGAARRETNGANAKIMQAPTRPGPPGAGRGTTVRGGYKRKEAIRWWIPRSKA